MLSAAGRIIAVTFGFITAAIASGFVVFRLSIERVTGALHNDDDAFGTALSWVGNLLQLSFFMTLLLALLVVIVGEVARIRSALFYIAGGGIAVAAAPLLTEVHRAGGMTGLPAFVWQVFATAGFAGGALYWLLAGRRA